MRNDSLFQFYLNLQLRLALCAYGGWGMCFNPLIQHLAWASEVLWWFDVYCSKKRRRRREKKKLCWKRLNLLRWWCLRIITWGKRTLHFTGIIFGLVTYQLIFCMNYLFRQMCSGLNCMIQTKKPPFNDDFAVFFLLQWTTESLNSYLYRVLTEKLQSYHKYLLWDLLPWQLTRLSWPANVQILQLSLVPGSHWTPTDT